MSTATESKHTPGPWRLANVWAGDDDTIYSGTMALARVMRNREHVGTPIREWSANARLIAAAPAMLEALEAIIAEADQSNGGKGAQLPIVLHIRGIAEEAIRLAKGEL